MGARPALTKAARMRQLLREERPVVSPGVFDCYSAMIVEAMGFKCAAMSGSALSNSLIGQPRYRIAVAAGKRRCLLARRTDHLDPVHG